LRRWLGPVRVRVGPVDAEEMTTFTKSDTVYFNAI
jgi:hypothetical protein